MKKNSKALIYKILAAVIAFVLLVLLFSIGSDQDSDTRYTVYSRSRNGLMAIYDTLKEVGFDVQLALDPLDNSLPDGTLFILSPAAPPGSGEIAALKKWVARGNTLVCATQDSTAAQMESFGLPQQQKGLKSEPVNDCSLTDGVRSLRVGISMNNIPDTFGFEEWASVKETGIGSRFNKDSKKKIEYTDKIPVLPLFAIGRNPVAGIAAWGKGRVICVGTPQCFSNALVDKDDNAIFLTNILLSSSKTGNRRAIFYEYGNGYERLVPGAGLIRLIDKPVRTAIIIFIVAFLLLVLLEAQRFGPVKLLIEKTRFRSEYLSALADLLNRGGGTDIVLDELGRKFTEDVTKQLGLNSKADIALIVDTAKNRGLEKPALLHELLQEAARTHVQVSNENAFMVARQWHKMRKELSTLR